MATYISIYYELFWKKTNDCKLYNQYETKHVVSVISIQYRLEPYKDSWKPHNMIVLLLERLFEFPLPYNLAHL